MQEQHKKQPEISIIVPVYKTERFLSACISSILAQTFTDFELILVDDGSPDSCPALCDAAAAKDSRIRVIHQKNRGLSGARNAGLDAAEGEWIAFVDSDDTITPDFCAKLYHAAQEAGAQMAVCNYRQVDEALTPIREQYLHVRREVLTPEQALEHSTLLPYMVVWNKLYHRSIFAQLRKNAAVVQLVPHHHVGQKGAVLQRLLRGQHLPPHMQILLPDGGQGFVHLPVIAHGHLCTGLLRRMVKLCAEVRRDGVV